MEAGPFDKSSAQEHASMTQEAINLLRKKVSEAAHKVASLEISEDDIALVTKAVVIGAERSGNPITEEELNAFGPELQTVILGGLIRRIEARPSNSKYGVIDERTLEYVAGGESPAKAGEKAREQRGIAQ